jgi:hypothetical protein
MMPGISGSTPRLHGKTTSFSFPTKSISRRCRPIPPRVAAFHYGFPYFVYGVMGFLAALFTWKFIPETKGRTLEELEQLWEKKT